MAERIVYECWVHRDKDSFCKIYSDWAVADWLKQQLKKREAGAHIHVVIHDQKEYHAGNDTLR